MKNSIIIFTILIMALIPIFNVQAEIAIEETKIYDIINGNAKLSWKTSTPAKGTIYYGDNSNNLNRTMGHSTYSKEHITYLTGLEKSKKYYYKIKAWDELGTSIETAIYDFNTNDMQDTIAPKILEESFIQAIDDAAVISWTTDEETRATVYFSSNPNNLNREAGYGGYDKKHTLFIYNLESSVCYTMKIMAEDRDRNKAYTNPFQFCTPQYQADEELSISQISINELGIRSTNISWYTDLAAKSKIYYGPNLDHYEKEIEVNKQQKNHHNFELTDLRPYTTYYYKIRAYDSFHGKWDETPKLSFKTKALENQKKIGSLIKGSEPKVYVAKDNSQISWIENEEVFTGYGYQWNWIEEVGDDDLAQYEEVDSISEVGCHPDGTLIKYPDNNAVYMIGNCKKRPFFTAEAFEKRGYSWDRIITLPLDKGYGQGENIY